MMKKVFKLIDLDCAHCAQKMEDAINKINGVNKATINFMAMKLTVDAQDDLFESVMDQAVKACKKIEPACTIQR